MAHRDSYVPHRRLLYTLLWMVAVAELGLTAYRIHFTKSNFGGTYDPIIVELLSVSIFTVIWAPLTLLFHRSALSARGAAAGTSTSRRGGSRLGFLHGETSGNFILWMMWLVGAAIATNTWPKRALAPPGKQGRIIIAIIALAWTAFGLLTLAKILAAMEYAARNAVGYGGAAAAAGPDYAGGYGGREKPANTAGAGPATTV